MHYLAEVRRGGEPIRRPHEFALFALHFPSLVAGPIKRYQDYLPSLHAGLARVSVDDVAAGARQLCGERHLTLGCLEAGIESTLVGIGLFGFRARRVRRRRVRWTSGGGLRGELLDGGLLVVGYVVGIVAQHPHTVRTLPAVDGRLGDGVPEEEQPGHRCEKRLYWIHPRPCCELSTPHPIPSSRPSPWPVSR